MSWLGKFIGEDADGQKDQPAEASHAVLLHLMLGNSEFGFPGEVEQMHALEAELEQSIADAGAGELDGNEIGGGECIIFMYGPNADTLWLAIAPALIGKKFTPGSYAVKRYGDPDTGKKVRVELNDRD